MRKRACLSGDGICSKVLEEEEVCTGKVGCEPNSHGTNLHPKRSLHTSSIDCQVQLILFRQDASGRRGARGRNASKKSKQRHQAKGRAKESAQRNHSAKVKSHKSKRAKSKKRRKKSGDRGRVRTIMIDTLP